MKLTETMKKYKFTVFDIDGCLRDSECDYNLLFASFEDAEKEALKEIDRIEKSCKESFENSLITGYAVEKVGKKPADLTKQEQEAYKQVVTLINKYVYIVERREKVIEVLDNLVEILKKGDTYGK